MLPRAHQLAHAADDRLARLPVGMDLEGRVLLHQLGERQDDEGDHEQDQAKAEELLAASRAGFENVPDFTVAEPDLPLVRRYLDNPNLKVVTDAGDDNIAPRTGTLYFIDNAVQPGAGTVKLRGLTPNPDRALWPSQFVHVRLILDVLKDAKLVPSGAVQIGQNGPYMFVVKPDSTLDLRQVKPGQRQGDLTVITEGVNAGETVVVSGQLQLSPGTKVIAKEIEQGSSLPSSKTLN